jgi:hypothetical protein
MSYLDPTSESRKCLNVEPTVGCRGQCLSCDMMRSSFCVVLCGELVNVRLSNISNSSEPREKDTRRTTRVAISYICSYPGQTVALLVLDDGLRRTTRPPASFDSQIYKHHINKPRLVSKLIFFKRFLNFFSTEFQNEWGRKPRRPPPPPRRRTGLILLYRISEVRPLMETMCR